MSEFIIIETQAHDIEWAVEASSVDEARRAFVETGAGERLAEHPHDENGIVKIIDPCGETAFEVVSKYERAVRRIHEMLDGTEWQTEFLDLIAGEIEDCGLKVRNRLVACDVCGQDEVEENADLYEVPIDYRDGKGGYLVEAGDLIPACPDCQTSIEEEALRNHRGL